MRLGVKRNEVKIVPYTAEWKEEFAEAKAQIQHHTELRDMRIEHIGSTAIKGMHAKPLIDILVGIDTITPPDKDVMKGLQGAGFLRLRVERPEAIVCAKFTDNTYHEKTHYVHVVTFQGRLWKDLIFFRDYLNAHEKARVKYISIKQEFLNNQSGGIDAYTDSKEAFVKEIYAKRKEK